MIFSVAWLEFLLDLSRDEYRVLVFVDFVPFCGQSLLVSYEEARKDAKGCGAAED